MKITIDVPDCAHIIPDQFSDSDPNGLMDARIYDLEQALKGITARIEKLENVQERIYQGLQEIRDCFSNSKNKEND